MPIRRDTPAHKRRVRTGCLACRKRRRKCDEQKPSCRNCDARGALCEYPGLSIVTASPPHDSPESDPSRPPPAIYKAITFVDETQLRTNQTPIPETSVTETQLVSSLLHTEVCTPEVEGSQTLGDPTSLASVGNHSVSVSLPSQSSWDRYFSLEHDSPAKRDAAILLHFRYNIVPWVDFDAPGSRFGSDIMRLAQSNDAILLSIIALSTTQLELLNKTSHLGEASDSFLQQAESQLRSLDGWTRSICQHLLAVGRFFRSRPSEWGNSFLYDANSHLRSPLEYFDEPLRTLTRLALRIDLASCILGSKPPVARRAFYTRGGSEDIVNHNTALTVYDASLSLLSECLLLIYGDPGSLDSLVDSPTALSQAPNSQFLSRWHSLWMRCEQWYGARPLTMLPVLDMGTLESGQIETNGSSFPMQIYTSSVALQANAVYHITSRLLLSCRPRLLQMPRQRRWLASSTWHVQQLAGIATRNDFADQWDPLLISGLLHIAKDMTHIAQQQALLTCFEKITAATGLNLEDETKSIQARWDVLVGTAS